MNFMGISESDAANAAYAPKYGSKAIWPTINIDFKTIVLGSLSSIDVNIGGRFLIAPVPLGALYAKVNLEGKTFACLNAKSEYEIWGSVSISGAMSYTIGAAHQNAKYAKKAPKGSERNNKELDYSSGNLVKLKKLHRQALKNKNKRTNGGKAGLFACSRCPKGGETWVAGIELAASGFAGAGIAATAKVGYKWEWNMAGYKGGQPVVSGGASWGVGVEAAVDVTVTGTFKGKIADL